MRPLRYALLLMALVYLGCEPSDASQDAAPTGTSRAQADAITTQPLTPETYEITLADLPKPYATESVGKGPNVIDVPDEPVLYAPEGFSVHLFADDLDGPRWMTTTPDGDVLVAESRQGRILRLRDTDSDDVADERSVFADEENGLNLPFGMLFTDGYFYVANTDAVVRYPYAEGQDRIEGRGEAITDLPEGGNHWTRDLALSADGTKLYVSVGSRSNVDVEESPRATILVMNLDGTGREVFGAGIRNPVAVAVHPATGEVYTTVNERDLLGDNLVPDYLTHVEAGGFYGWPYAYLAPDNLDPRRMDGDQSEAPDLAAQTITPDVLFQAHSAALGLAFAPEVFPEDYRHGAFVAFHGSWNRDQGTGYKVVYVPFGADDRPTGAYQDFLTGFLVDPSGPDAWGRPVGLLVHEDGSLLVADDGNGRIYRVRHAG